MLNHYRHLVCILFLLFSVQFLMAQSVRMPAEWEKQERVYLTWFGKERRDSVSCRVIQALLPQVAITLNLQKESLLPVVRNKLKSYAIDPEKIQFIIDSASDFWTRDPFLFVKTGNKKLSVVQFSYTMYGFYPDLAGEPVPADIQQIGEYGARLSVRHKFPLIKVNLFLKLVVLNLTATEPLCSLRKWPCSGILEKPFLKLKRN
jgi:hypothetical protein